MAKKIVKRKPAKPKKPRRAPVLVSIGPMPEWDHLGISSLVPGTKKALVPSQDTDSISLVDLVTMEVDFTAKLGKGAAPWHVVATPDGQFAYATNARFTGHVDTTTKAASVVSVVSLTQQKMVREIPVGAGPVMIEMDKQRSRAYVTNRFSNTVSIIDLKSHKTIGEFATPSAPFWIKLSPDNNILIVSCFEDASLEIYDANTLAKVQSLPVGSKGLTDPYPEFGPGDTIGFAISSDNKVFVANWRSHSIAVVDLTIAMASGRRGVTYLSSFNAKYPFAIQLIEDKSLMVVGCYDVRDSNMLIYRFDGKSLTSPRLHSVLPVDGSLLPQGEAATVNYWMSEPFQSRLIGYLGEGLGNSNPIVIAAVL